MIKKAAVVIALAATCITSAASAQSRVFKEVANQISSQVKPIMQDNALIGYVLLTQLEKVSKDSFSYKLNIMDENLNDIGHYSFLDQNLQLQATAFEQDVLCLAYLRSDAPDKTNIFQFRSLYEKTTSYLYSQFLNLEGKLIASSSVPVKLMLSGYAFNAGERSNVFKGSLSNKLRITNIPGKGFAYTYGDGIPEYYGQPYSSIWGQLEAKNKTKETDLSPEYMSIYNLEGKHIWYKMLPSEKSEALNILIHNDNLYVLRKTVNNVYEGGYELLSYNLNDTSYFKRRLLTDKKGDGLKVLGFRQDFATGIPHISGMVINHKFAKRSTNLALRHLTKPLYTGAFDITVKDGACTDHFSYWADGSKGMAISKKGYITEAKSYTYLNYSFDDFSGNTYYAGSGVIKKVRWPNIIISTLTSPLILPPLLLAHNGIYKYKFRNMILMKQDTAGKLSYFSTQEANNSRFHAAVYPLESIYVSANKDFFSVKNETTQSHYIILDDPEDIFIYNVGSKKLTKKIPHRNSKVLTNVYKAKEGHIMLSEFNLNDNSTKLSIEAL